MTSLALALAGIGIWSERFGDFEQFAALVRGEPVAAGSKPPAERIPARERRRAPPFVRMGVEVMDQACRMAGIDASSVATVFGSSLGDVETTDYMCRTLATEPRSLSPTRFHNSVHNACTGYWSIATGAHSSASAVSAYDRSPAIVLLEGAIQAAEERVPVVVAFQEPGATRAFESIFPARHPLAVGLLLLPGQIRSQPLGTLSLEIVSSLPPAGGAPMLVPELAGNFAASMVDFLIAAAEGRDYTVCLPVSDARALMLGYAPRTAAL